MIRILFIEINISWIKDFKTEKLSYLAEKGS